MVKYNSKGDWQSSKYLFLLFHSFVCEQWQMCVSGSMAGKGLSWAPLFSMMENSHSDSERQ